MKKIIGYVLFGWPLLTALIISFFTYKLFFYMLLVSIAVASSMVVGSFLISKK